jgi:tetratricopeptide (TPR) repeat protein
MGLTKTQKKFLKKNIKRASLSQLAQELKIPEKEVKEYLKKLWDEEKYRRYIDAGKPVAKAPLEFLPPVGLKIWLKTHWKYLFILTVLVFACYAGALKHDYVSDDISGIKANPDIERSISYWHPPFFYIRPFILALIHKFFGLNQIAYRGFNILLHLGSVLVIYILISLFYALPLPFFVAALFAVHPVLIECVTWISGGVYAQYTFFLFLSLLIYIWGKNRRWAMGCAIFFSVLAFLSNEKAVVFPLIIAAWEFAGGNLKKHWLRMLPYFVIVGILVLLYLRGLTQRFAVLQTQFAIANRTENPLLQVPIATNQYFRMLFWPQNLTFYYARTNFSYAEYYFTLFTLFLWLAAVVFCYVIKKRWTFFWLSFFFITLLPTLTPLRVASHMAERYVYFGSVGIFMLVGLVFFNLARVKWLKIPVYIIFCVLIGVLSWRTIVRNKDWKNEETLWISTIKVSPESVNAHHNMGNIYFNRGDIPNAIKEYETAIALMPGYADPYNNLAYIYQRTGKNEEAKKVYLKALSFNPNLWQSYRGLAVITFGEGKFEESAKYMLEAIRSAPRNAQLYTDMAAIYTKLGNRDKAKEYVKEALSINPNDGSAKQLDSLLKAGFANINVTLGI